MISQVQNIDCMEVKKPHHWLGKKHSEATKQKIRASKMGINNPMKQKEVAAKRSKTIIVNGTFAGANNHRWKGGDKKYRGVDWKHTSAERRKLDNYKCYDCGKQESEMKILLDVHHIIDYKNGGTNEITNLVSLCRSCHNKRRTGHAYK